MYCVGSWHKYDGGRRHPYDTATGDEGRCNHCGQRESLLHRPPYEACQRCGWRVGDPVPPPEEREQPSNVNDVFTKDYWRKAHEMDGVTLPIGWELCPNDCPERSKLTAGVNTLNLREWDRQHMTLSWWLGRYDGSGDRIAIAPHGIMPIHTIERLWPEPKKTDDELLAEAIRVFDMFDEIDFHGTEVDPDIYLTAIQAGRRVVKALRDATSAGDQL